MLFFATQSKAITDILFIHMSFKKDLSCVLYAKSLKIFSRSIMFLAMSFSTDSIAKLFSFSCEIVDRKYALISFNFEQPLSPDATVIAVKTFGNAVKRWFTTRYSDRA